MANQDEIELPDQGDNIIRTHDPVLPINQKGLADEIMKSMERNIGEIAQIDAESGQRETFGEVLDRSVRVAVNLKKYGVMPGDNITLCSTNHLNTSVVFYATLFVGAIPANIDPFASDDETKEQLKLIEPKFVFAISEVVDKLERVIGELSLTTKIVVFGCTNHHTSFSCFLEQSQEAEKFTPYEVGDIYDTAIIVFSSGSTGFPKGICLTHYAWLTFLATLPKGFNGFLSFASMVWFSATLTSLSSAVLGSTRLLCNGFTPEKTWRYLKQYKPSSVALVPQDYMALVRSKKPEGLDVSHVLAVVIAGGGISLESRNLCKKLFPTSMITALYGQTELNGSVVKLRHTKEGMDMLMKKPMMCGMPIKGVTYKIVDPETEEILGPNQAGELRVKTKSVMNGYYKMECHDRFDKDGFLKTGDRLYYDEDHCFFFVERLMEALRYKMFDISPLELENILIDHPSVKVAVVLGKPTDEGDLAFAVVVKNDDGVTAEELEQLVASKVDDRKRLRGGVIFVKHHEIPFAASGKIRRRVLREYIFNNYKI